FASAAPVIAFGGYGAAFALNAASFAVCAVALLALRPRTDGEDRGAEEPGREEGTGRPGCRRPWRGAAGLPGLLLGMILLRGVDALASSSHNVALPVVAHAAEPSAPARSPISRRV
ncbi:MFS transporter, partial [Streptomyces sp. NRRL WC-3753]